MNKKSEEVKKIMKETGLAIVGVANFLASCNGNLRTQVNEHAMKAEKMEKQTKNLQNLCHHQRQAIEELTGALARVSECLQQMQKYQII